MKCAIIAFMVVVIMHDISIHRLYHDVEELKSLVDIVLRKFEETVSERTEQHNDCQWK